MARRSLILLIILNLLTYMDRFVLSGVEKFIAEEVLPGDPNALAKMGSLAAALLISYMLCSPIFGILGTRMSRWLLVGIGTIAGSLATGATGLAGTMTTLLLARACVGISEAAYAPVAPTILADLYPVEKRGRTLAYFYAAMPVGGALGYAFGGIVLAFTTWHYAFILLAIPGILAGIVALFFKDPRKQRGRPTIAVVATPSPAPSPTSHIPHPASNLLLSRAATYATLFRIPSYALCSAGMTAMTFAFGSITFFMPRFLHNRYVAEIDPHTAVAKINLAFGAISAVVGLVATLSGGFIGDRLRTRFPGSYFLVSGAGLILGFPCFLLVLFLPFPYAWIALVLAVFTLFFNTGPSNTILANVTPAALRPTAFALNIFIIHLLGDASSPFLTGLIADHSSLRSAFIITSCFFLLGGIFWLLGAKHLAKDTAAAEAINAASPPSTLPTPTSAH